VKILVINTGSSTIKYRLFDMGQQMVLASGLVEKIGEETGTLTHSVSLEDGQTTSHVYKASIADHGEGMTRIVSVLVSGKGAVVADKSEITAVGHRVVHGGETFKASMLIDDDTVEAIRKNIPLAPLHNPPNLTGIEVAKEIFPDAAQVAVFDTAFHQTLPKKAFLYALPYALYEKEGVRRYGFHGTSHAYVAQACADYLKEPLEGLKLVTVHLGNGASMAAIKKGKSVDTTMGMTPLEGLVMGTRCGDVDPALPFFLADHLEMSLREINSLLNKESGLKGLCGFNDMREVLDQIDAGNDRARVAVDIYTYRIKKYIGAYFAALEGFDGLVFTGGIGEKSTRIRAWCCAGLDKLGIVIDREKNAKEKAGIRSIHATESTVKILVVPTNEELKIAMETKEVIQVEGV
jgi:acetate kinase